MPFHPLLTRCDIINPKLVKKVLICTFLKLVAKASKWLFKETLRQILTSKYKFHKFSDFNTGSDVIFAKIG